MTSGPQMDGQVDYIELVEQARQGNRQSLNRLAEVARERLRVYVYRLTQQDDLTQEIVQESLLEMCKVLGKLKRTDRFWSWLYGIATNKLHRHYRTERALQRAAASEERRCRPMKERQGGLEDLVSQELRQIVSTAMQKLRTRHKAVLVMRCYDGMSYSEIAESMGCSEFSTRMLFMRAKQALQKELSRNGFGKGSLLAALVIFGKITAPSEAVAAQLTVPAAAMEVGLLAGAVGVATTKTALLSMTAAGALTVGAVMATSGPEASTPSRLAVTPRVANSFETGNDVHQAYWLYFRDGPDEPMMLRATSGDAAGATNHVVLQNREANLSYEGRIVREINHRMWMEDLSVFTLPTDSSEMRAFLAQMQGQDTPMESISAKGGGLLVVIERNDEGQDPRPWAVRHWNVMDEDYFQSDWRADATVVDDRDAMHRRGWTYFRVRGQINGSRVTGVGRIPFVSNAAKEHYPWLRLRIGTDLTILDSGSSACILDRNGTVVNQYTRGSFFSGLSRPWMGLHTIDIVRRDAARQKVPFQTAVMPDGRDVQVTAESGRTRLVYTIDLETDIVETITFSVGDAAVGSLEFEYLQDLPDVRNEFLMPGTGSYHGPMSQDQGMLWLIRLADGTLADR